MNPEPLHRPLRPRARVLTFPGAPTREQSMPLPPARASRLEVTLRLLFLGGILVTPWAALWMGYWLLLRLLAVLH